MSIPSHSSSSSLQSVATSEAPAAAPSQSGQSLRWSLQNFPVPLQFQARIPRSPLSVAQELLPNFPSSLMQHYGYDSPPPQSHVSLQQHLQQQFQRQLQLNLQGGGESSHPVMPDPPDTILDMDMPARGGSGDRNFGGSSQNAATSTTSSIRSGLSSSAHILEALFRGTPGTSSAHQRVSGGNEIGRLIARGASSHNYINSPGSSHHHQHGHSHSHNYQNSDSSSNSDLSSMSGSSLNSDNSRVPGPAATGPAAVEIGAARNGNGPNGEGVPQGAELTLLYKWMIQSGVFLLLLFLHFLYDHRLGLLVFLCLGGTFYYCNMKLVHAIHQSAVREPNRSWPSLLTLLWLCGFLIVNISVLYYVFSDQQLYRLLIFQMAVVPDISIWTLLWCVVMTDYVIKFLTVIAKSVLAMFQPCSKNYRHRGKYYHLMESTSQLYRQVVTVMPWLYYLSDSARTSVWFAFFTEAVYLGFKGWSVWGSVQILYNSFQIFQSNTSFGIKPSSTDLLDRGNQCPICQDTVNEPVMLTCKHIFCEQCVSIWFDREKTCPMCRAEITTESPMWRDGNTSHHLQWH